MRYDQGIFSGAKGRLRQTTTNFVEQSMLHFALRELQTYFSNRRVQTILAGIIVICIISGPFSTLQLTVFERFLYWSFSVFGSAALSKIAFIATEKTLQRFSLPTLLRLFCCNLVNAVIVGVFIFVTTRIVWGSHNHAPSLLMLIGITFIISIFITMLVWYNSEHSSSENSVNHEPDENQENHKEEPQEIISSESKNNALFERLPKDLGRDLISLSSQDHYLEVITTKGQTLILMRLSDAINALPTELGLQIHRSHWVAKSAIIGLDRSGGKWQLKLTNNTQLPVSRNYREDIKALDLH